MDITITTIQIKRGDKTTWATKNLVLLKGEPGYEVDTHKLKIGDGITAWNDLPYIGDNTVTISLGNNMIADTDSGVIYSTTDDGETVILAESTDAIDTPTIQNLFS